MALSAEIARLSGRPPRSERRKPRRTNGAATAALVGPAVAELGDAVAREISNRVRAALDRDVGNERLERFLNTERPCPKCAARDREPAPAPVGPRRGISLHLAPSRFASSRARVT